MKRNILPKTLASFKKLDRQPDEIVVVDGGSTDKTAKVARKKGAKVITVEHRGIGYARDKGLLKATCDIVAFTDADTIVPHDWLVKIEETLPDKRCRGIRDVPRAGRLVGVPRIRELVPAMAQSDFIFRLVFLWRRGRIWHLSVKLALPPADFLKIIKLRRILK